MTTNALASRNCIPCEGGVPPLDSDSVAHLLAELGEIEAVGDLFTMNIDHNNSQISGLTETCCNFINKM